MADEEYVREMAEPIGERPAMRAYGVDSDDWEALPWAWAAERLETSRNFWLVTVSADGRPHSMPVWGVWDEPSHRFCCSCAPSARKARNLDENDRVVVTTSDTVEVVSIEGTGRVLAPMADGDAIDAWIDRYLTKYTAMAPDLSDAFLRRNLLIEVVPDRAFGIIEREDEFATRATRWRF